MRLDKYLKVSRLVKRRSVANELASSGHVKINDKVAKAGTQVKVGDVLAIRFGEDVTYVQIARIQSHVPKDEAPDLYEILDGPEKD